VDTDSELQRLEGVIRNGDGDSIRARWEFGRYLHMLKKDKKQLPRGVLKHHTDQYHVSRSELSARRKFAEQYPTPDEVSTVMESFRTWTAIKQTLTKKPLTKKPRVHRPAASPIRLLLDLLDNFDTGALTREEAEELQKAITRITARVATVGVA
jgi:hypothetical protein